MDTEARRGREMDNDAALIESGTLSSEFLTGWAHQLKYLQSLASQTPEAEIWLARVDEVDHWTDCPAELPARLVDLPVQ